MKPKTRANKFSVKKDHQSYLLYNKGETEVTTNRK